jgi:two-component system, NtrC family, response regulator AtoC
VRLQAHAWPGNVRELRNVLDRALILAGDKIEGNHIVFDECVAKGTAPTTPVVLEADEAGERERIVSALDQCAGNQTRAAKLLGMSRSTLATKLAILRIPRPRS